MVDAVKRTYASPRRAEQARQTRRAILDAARTLFAANGYAAIPVAGRDRFREVMAQPDPVRQLELLAPGSGQVKSRAGDLMEVLRYHPFVVATR